MDIMCVKDISKYWERRYHDTEQLLGNLQRKHEFGTSIMCSEAGIQRSCSYYAGNIARKHGADHYKTVTICRLVGLCFPKYGEYGFAAIMQYFDNRGLYFMPENLRIYVIEQGLYNSGIPIPPELDKALHQYYDNDQTCLEVNIARACQIKIAESRELIKQGLPAGESIARIMKPFESEYLPNQSHFFYQEKKLEVPEHVKNEVFSDLDQFLDYDPNERLEDAISDYIFL